MKSKWVRTAAGVATALLAILGAQKLPAQTYTVLYTFTLPGTYYQIGPYAGVIQDAKGHLYGTTGAGGTVGNGTLFKLSVTAKGKEKEKVLYNFDGDNDGSGPAGLIREANGTFYGNTYYGGADGFGTVYELTKKGKETLLYSFTSGADGAYPQSPLIRDAHGNLYGTAFSYGGPSSGGTIFKISKTGVFTVLYTFMGKPDGARPSAGVIEDADGNLYGTTAGGGANGVGSVFMFSTSTGKETVLYSFKGSDDGENPYAGVIRDADGNLYGTTYDGGGPMNGGTVFELSPAGKETVLYSFTGSNGDGYNPNAGVIRDTAGNLYGTTYYGGAYGAGTVYKLSPTGKETVLYGFTGLADGGLPLGGVIMDVAGNLYGTTEYGGDPNCATEQAGCGVVFKLAP